ncbi:MAG: hypothetical protein PF495_13355 [Spirochaetales bacterium]|jgi:hypothetical protein|nr:hypothetical protein [Spirochaetales bacterium]
MKLNKSGIVYLLKSNVRMALKAFIFSVILCSCFYVAGIGMYLGFTHATPLGELLMGRTVVISLLDIERAVTYIDEDSEGE